MEAVFFTPAQQTARHIIALYDEAKREGLQNDEDYIRDNVIPRIRNLLLDVNPIRDQILLVLNDPSALSQILHTCQMEPMRLAETVFPGPTKPSNAYSFSTHPRLSMEENRVYSHHRQETALTQERIDQAVAYSNQDESLYRSMLLMQSLINHYFKNLQKSFEQPEKTPPSILWKAIGLEIGKFVNAQARTLVEELLPFLTLKKMENPELIGASLWRGGLASAIQNHAFKLEHDDMFRQISGKQFATCPFQKGLTDLCETNILQDASGIFNKNAEPNRGALFDLCERLMAGTQGPKPG